MSPPEPPRHQEASYYQVQPARRRRLPWLVGGLVWLAAGAGLGGVLSAAKQANDIVSIIAAPEADQKATKRVLDPEVRGEPQNILVIGSDKRPGEGDRGRSDSLILVRVDPDNDSISMLSFPRDMYVQIPNHGPDKINAAFEAGGAALTIETVKQLTGQPISAYVNVDFKGFVNLVDLVGGIYIDVDRRYFHVNAPGSCPGGANCYDELDIEPGYQRLSGVDALDYARFRHLDSDRSRIARQQIFLSELKRQLKSGGAGNILELGAFKRKVFPNFDTNITSASKFLKLVRTAIDVPKARIARTFIKGRNDVSGSGASIIRVSDGEIQRAVDAWLSPEFVRGNAPKKTVRPADVRIAVFNGSGRLLAAEQATDALKGQGYDAYSAGNWTNFGYGASAVFFAPDRRDAARQVQELLGEHTRIAPRIRKQVTPLSRESDLIVITGAEYAGITAPSAKRSTSRAVADVVPTLSLAPVMRSVQGASRNMLVLAPTVVARDSRVRRVRVYQIPAGRPRPAVKVVFESGFHRYWSIQEVRWKNPPILAGRTNTIRRCGTTFSTFYDGKNMQRLLWQRGEMTYWVSNGLPGDLDYPLSAETIYAVACSMQPAASARLRAGVTGSSIGIELDAPTP